VYCCPCGVGQATCYDSGLDIASTSGLEGNRVTDRCGTARLGGKLCPWKVWLHVQTVSCDDRRLDPAHDRDLSERKRLCSARGHANGSWLFGIDISCGRLLCLFMLVASRESRYHRVTGICQDWPDKSLVNPDFGRH